MAVHFEFSAGGVVTDPDGNLVLVAVRNFAGDRKVALPKGHVEKGESSLAAAHREVEEETGFTVEPQAETASSIIEYWFVRPDKIRVKKKVSFFRFEVTGGNPADHDNVEVDEVLVVPVPEGLELLSYRSERQAAEEALAT